MTRKEGRVPSINTSLLSQYTLDRARRVYRELIDECYEDVVQVAAMVKLTGLTGQEEKREADRALRQLRDEVLW